MNYNLSFSFAPCPSANMKLAKMWQLNLVHSGGTLMTRACDLSMEGEWEDLGFFFLS